MMLTAGFLGALAAKCFIEKTMEDIGNEACAGCPLGSYCSDAVERIPELVQRVQSVRDAAHNFNN